MENPKFIDTPISANTDGQRSIVLRRKSYIQPFEAVLAASEVRGLTETSTESLFTDPAPQTLKVDESYLETLLRRLTYWEVVEANGTPFIPDQIKLELSDEAEITSTLPLFDDKVLKLPRRRKLRYGPHDLHEYRGKFFPQLVRSLINSVGVPVGSVILDPTCGSGTTNVEARALGMTTIGVDLNPLSVLISNVKASIFDFDAGDMDWIKNIFLPSLAESEIRPIETISRWNDRDLKYLLNWFDPQAIQELAYILEVCEKAAAPFVIDFLKICLSNIIRAVSWQNDDDLRVRKNATTYLAGTTLQMFRQEVSRQVEKLSGYISFNKVTSKAATYSIIEGDTRDITSLLPDYVGKCDVIITSPPYATALPYIDTDRLSLIVLGLASRSEHRDLETEMIGNREVLENQRVMLWENYQKRRNELPECITVLIDQLADTNHSDKVGFRRRNLPALLSKYYLDMLDVMKQCYRMMVPNGYAFYIVGNNSTKVDGTRIEIPTDIFLWELGKTAGWSQVELLKMELLVSRDIFRKNRGSSESILVFRAIPERKAIYGTYSDLDVHSNEWDFSEENTQEHLHSIHPYPARFIPQIPRKAILEFTKPGDLVLDPFVGSGTTLLEASLLGRPSIGVDNNAVACLVSRAKISQYSQGDLQLLCDFCNSLPDFRDSNGTLIDTNIPIYKERDGWFDPDALLDLGFIKAQINTLPEPAYSLALATLSSIIVRVSYQDSDTRYARVQKAYRSGNSLKWYKLKLSQAIEGIKELIAHPRASSKVYLADTRDLSFIDDHTVDLIVTSPPYLNAYDYHKYHRHRLHWINGDITFAREIEIGKHDTFTKSKAVPEPYFEDMQLCFNQWVRVLKPGCHSLIVIGDSIVSGLPVAVGDKFVELLTDCGFELSARWIRSVKVERKSFNSQSRIKQEHVLLFRKP